MILSFHPLIIKDHNRLCAGRQPNAEDLAAIRAADAVVLPQGCYQSLYEMARKNCPRVFPNYDARFKYPGKSGQALLFQEIGVPHPETDIYQFVSEFNARSGWAYRLFPVVFKFDWGGEGESVFLIESKDALAQVLERSELYEKTGQNGFVLQEYIPTDGRSLRVVVVGHHLVSYWRVLPKTNAFAAGVATGARIDPDLDLGLQAIAKNAVTDFCKTTGINLAGFDILFQVDETGKFSETPLFIEINYFFGRRGLGGSTAYYQLFEKAVDEWIESLHLA